MQYNFGIMASLIVNDILPIAISMVGLAGNSWCFLVFSRSRFANLSMAFFFRVICLVDTFGIFQLLLFYLRNSHDINIRVYSPLMCKLFGYLAYSVTPISAWNLAYISLERFLTIRFANRIKLLKNRLAFFYVIIREDPNLFLNNF